MGRPIGPKPKEPDKEGRSPSLAFGLDCSVGCVEVNGGFMEKHNYTKHIYIIWLLMHKCPQKIKGAFLTEICVVKMSSFFFFYQPLNFSQKCGLSFLGGISASEVIRCIAFPSASPTDFTAADSTVCPQSWWHSDPSCLSSFSKTRNWSEKRRRNQWLKKSYIVATKSILSVWTWNYQLVHMICLWLQTHVK